jgi:hypothetical protein
MTVASTQYEQKKRYHKTYMLDMHRDADGNLLPRFFTTTPRIDKDLNLYITNNTGVATNIQIVNFLGVTPNYLNADGTDSGVSRWDPETGITKDVYKLDDGTYWYARASFDTSGNPTIVQNAFSYEVRWIQEFTHIMTADMPGGNYLYSIECIDGIETDAWILNELWVYKDELMAAYPILTIEQDPITLQPRVYLYRATVEEEEITQDMQTCLKYLREFEPEEVKNINLNDPIVIAQEYADVNEVIRSQMEWKVTTNINGRGLNKWPM